jgi:hypothetical protein
MILPLINTMTLKSGKPTKLPADAGAAGRPGLGRRKRPTAKTGLTMVALLTVALTMLRLVRRRPR